MNFLQSLHRAEKGSELRVEYPPAGDSLAGAEVADSLNFLSRESAKKPQIHRQSHEIDTNALEL